MTALKAKHKKVYTTGEIARLLSVNINTVIKWFDDGRIKGFRLPMSNDRRITASGLKTFMLDNEIPLELLDDDSQMRRKDKRFIITNDVEFTLTNGHAYGPYKGILSDLSLGGAKIISKGDKPISLPLETFRLDMRIIDDFFDDTNFGFSGDMVHLRPGKDEVAFGMRFFEMETETELLLNKFIENSCS